MCVVGTGPDEAYQKDWRSRSQPWVPPVTGFVVLVLLFFSVGTPWAFALALLAGAAWNLATWEWGTSGGRWQRVWRKYLLTGLFLAAAALFGGLAALEFVWA